ASFGIDYCGYVVDVEFASPLDDPVAGGISSNTAIGMAGSGRGPLKRSGAVAALVELRRLPRLKNVDLAYSSITDGGLANLETLSRLEVLHLEGCRVAGGGFVHLRGLVALRELYLDDSQFGDLGLAHLKRLNAIERLSL